MTDQHLEAVDIERLLDDEGAPAAAPFAAHLARCASCRALVEEARFVSEMLSTAPHLKPTREVTERVMGGVQFSAPGHVAVGESVRAALPEQGTARTAMLVASSFAALVTTTAVVWVALRANEAAVVAGVAVERGSALAIRVASEVAGTLFGPTAVELLRTHGLTAVAIAIPAFVLTSGVALAGFNALSSTARVRRG